MSREARRLTEERKITAQTYAENKINSVRLYRMFTDEDYVIWLKMSDYEKA